MRRLFILLLCLVMCWCMIACGEAATADSPDESAQETPVEKEESEEKDPELPDIKDQENDENKPEENPAEENQPEDNKPDENKPEEKPSDNKPAESKPSDSPQENHTHTYKTETADATCDREGYVRAVCSCGQIQSEAKLPKTSHNWKNASCAAPKTCQICGLTEGAALAHNWSEATYAKPKTCRNCQATEGSALAAPEIRVNATFPKDYYYYSRSFTVSSCQASFGTDSLGTSRYIRISMDVTRGRDNTPTAGKLALKVNVYDSQNRLVKQDSIWSDELATDTNGIMTASIPIPKSSQSDSYTISFEESY